jgi:UDP-N-acetylglucosamine transferase subunit ALG13
MATFEIEAPNGKKYQIQGETQEGAVAALRKHLGDASAPAAPSQTQSQPPEGMFLNPHTGAMTSRELLSNHFEQNASARDAAAMGYLQGFTLGSSDEIIGAVGKLSGDDHANFNREAIRAQQDGLARAYPGTTIASEVVGAVTNPVLWAIPGATTIKGAASIAAGTAAVEGFNRGEGGFEDRALNAGKGAATGFLFGAAGGAAFRGVNKGLQRAFNASVKRPTLGNLQSVKNKAYQAVDDAGEVFDRTEMQDLYAKASQVLQANDFDDIADPQTAAALRILERRQGEDVSLGRLDKLRQSMWKRYSRSDEPLILDVIGEIDTMIESRAGTSELMSVARAANSRFKKSEMLEDAFNKARLQTSSTGSGGNILNKYRQAITSIVVNPKKAKWFEAEELALMESFIEGDAAENVLRKVGKLAPGGNGLMTALNVYGATVNPSLLAVTAVASSAKGAADRKAIAGSEAILDVVSGVQRGAPAAAGDSGIVAGALAGSTAR